MKITNKLFFAASFVVPMGAIIADQVGFGIPWWVQLCAFILGAFCFVIQLMIGDDVIEIPSRHIYKSN